MHDDLIRDLIRRADELVGPPPGANDLAARVRRTARRQAARRRATLNGTIAAAGLGLVALVYWSAADADREGPLPGSPAVAQSLTGHDAARLRAEVGRIRAEVEHRSRLVAQMEAVRRHWEQRETPLASTLDDPIVEARAEVCKASTLMVYQADQMDRELGLRDSAIETYRRVIALFPDTQGADEARQRLAQMDTQPGDMI